jgi:hypothetical protein
LLELVRDLKTMVANAKTYNEPESEVHRDAQLMNVRHPRPSHTPS